MDARTSSNASGHTSSSSRRRRKNKHRRSASGTSIETGRNRISSTTARALSSVEPVKITTISRNSSVDEKAASSTVASTAWGFRTTDKTVEEAMRSSSGITAAGGGGSAGGLKTIAQVRELGKGGSFGGSVDAGSASGSAKHHAPPPSAAGLSGERTSSGTAAVRGGAGLTLAGSPPPETVGGGMEVVSVAGGESMRSPLSKVEDEESRMHSESEYPKSEASSVVTRVYARSMAGDESNNGGEDAARLWAEDEQESHVTGEGYSPNGSGAASPIDQRAMSQVSIAASRYAVSPKMSFQTSPVAASVASAAVPVAVAAAAASELPPHRAGPLSPGQQSVAASRFDSFGPLELLDKAATDAKEAAAVGEAGKDGGDGSSPGSFRMDPHTPTSAAGSRFPDSPSSYATSRLPGSPTAGGRARGQHTSRSTASSMRSGSFFPDGASTSNRSMNSGSAAGISSVSGSSWDEDDLQNVGARWLSDRAFNQKFS